jgi:hypothetical protein
MKCLIPLMRRQDAETPKTLADDAVAELDP